MKFSNIEEAVNFVKSLGEDRIASYEFSVNLLESVEPVQVTAVEEAPAVEILEESVGIASLSSTPEVTASLDKTLEENVLYVESFDSVPYSCSTGKVSMFGRTLHCNICEADDTGPVIHLNIKLHEHIYHNVAFKLRKTGDEKPAYIMLLNPKTLTLNV